MKGFSSPVKLSSLRPELTGGRNQQFATLCRNASVRKNGIDGYLPDLAHLPTIALGGGTLDLTVDWPFPQIFNTDTGIYIGTKTGLYAITHTAGVWSAALITSTYSHGIQWPWTLANCPMFPVFASGDLLVYYDYDATAWIAFNRLYDEEHGSKWIVDFEQPISACHFRGQVIMAGATVNTGSPSQSRIVRWSDIGAFNFLGASANPRKNVAGEMYLPLDNYDIAMRVLPLGESVIVYSNFQIVELQPAQKPAVTFAITNIKDIGINNPLAVGGHEKEHILIDRTGALYSHTWTKGGAERGTGLKYLGFEEYLLPLVEAADITSNFNLVSIVYNPGADEYYISNGRTSYLYKGGGLTEMAYSVTSLVDFANTQITNQSEFTAVDGSPAAIYMKTTDDMFYYESDTLDFGLLGIKTLEGLDLMGDFGDTPNAEVMVKWRNNKRGLFNETKWKRVSPEGFCAPLVSGVEFRVCIRIHPCTDVSLDMLMAKWKITDKRFIRGNYNATGNAA
jgi:hypothetical protein